MKKKALKGMLIAVLLSGAVSGCAKTGNSDTTKGAGEEKETGRTQSRALETEKMTITESGEALPTKGEKEETEPSVSLEQESIIDIGPRETEKPLETTQKEETVPASKPEFVPDTQPDTPPTEPPTEPTAVTTQQAEPVLSAQVVETDTTLYTYDMMAKDLKYLAAWFPDRLSVSTAGVTADGREIYRALFGNPEAERQIFIGAATHGREYMTTQLVMKQLEFYCENYDTASYGGKSFREIFSRTCFVVVPMINPDGVSISQLGEAGIRDGELRANLAKIYASDVAAGYTGDGYAYYLTRWKANARGVDLNRNFSTGWETVAERSAPSSTFYKGTAPGSEAEAVALMQVIDSMSHPLMAISYHSYGDLVYWQYGQAEPLWTANQNLATHISNLTGHYLAGYSNEAGFSNWCIRERGILSVTVETGTVPCPLPLDQFAHIWAQHQYTWPMLAVVYENG